jgi:hypothetical protein
MPLLRSLRWLFYLASMLIHFLVRNVLIVVLRVAADWQSLHLTPRVEHQASTLHLYEANTRFKRPSLIRLRRM